jgi:hypothetical protein
MDPGADVECRVQAFEEGGVRGRWMLVSSSWRWCRCLDWIDL